MTQSRSDRDMWDSISLDLISVQINGEIVYINTAGAKMLGAATLGQLIGKPILDFVHPDYREIAAERARLTTCEGIVVCPSAEKWLRLDGTAIDVEVAAMPMCYEGQPAVQIIVREDSGCKPCRPARHWRSAIRLRHK